MHQGKKFWKMLKNLNWMKLIDDILAQDTEEDDEETDDEELFALIRAKRG